MTIITGTVSDSAGQPANGRIEFAQVTRIDTGETLVTQTIATAQVAGGEILALDGGAFALPSNLDGSAVRVREILGGRTFEWWAQIPSVDQVEYRTLVPVVVVGPSQYGPPGWLAGVYAARDETIDARDATADIVADAHELVATLGGLAGVQASVAAAQTAAGTAATEAGHAKTEADRAKTEADRAEAAADSVEFPSVDLVTPMKARRPIWIAHRGGYLVRPEHSLEAYRFAAKSGFMIEQDVRALADGTLVVIHDATTARTMTGPSMTVSAMTRQQWEQKWILPPGSPQVKTGNRAKGAYFTDVLDEFGGRTVMWAELKDNSTPVVTAFIKAITDRHLQNAVVAQTGDWTAALAMRAAGLRTLYLSDTADPAQLANAGIEFVAASVSASNTYISSMVAAGVLPIVWTANTKQVADAQLARGAAGIYSDDPWRVSRMITPPASLDLSEGALWPMWAASSGTTASPGDGTQKIDITGGELVFTTQQSVTKANCLQLGAFGVGGPTVTVRLWAQSLAPNTAFATPEVGWIFGLYLGEGPADGPSREDPDERLRLAFVRRNGERNIYDKPDPAVAATRVGTVAAPATPYVPVGKFGPPMRFEIEFTPTSTTIRNLTLGDTDCVGTHPSWAGSSNLYLTLNVKDANSRIWGVSVVRAD